MVYIHVPFTIRAERFETFVIFSRHAHVTHGAILHLFADCLSVQLVCLMFFETRATSKVSVARHARNSVFGVRTRRNRLAVATRLSALVRHATLASFTIASEYILSRHRARKTLSRGNISTSYTIFFFRIPPVRRKISSQFNAPKTTILYSLKCSCNIISSGTPPPVDKSIPVVSSKRSTMGRVLHLRRYEL